MKRGLGLVIEGTEYNIQYEKKENSFDVNTNIPEVGNFFFSIKNGKAGILISGDEGIIREIVKMIEHTEKTNPSKE